MTILLLFYLCSVGRPVQSGMGSLGGNFISKMKARVSTKYNKV